MNAFPVRVLRFISVLTLFSPGIAKGAGLTDLSSTTTPSPTSTRHHHHKKKEKSDTAIGKSSDTVAESTSTHAGIAAGNGAIPGVTHDSQAGSVGSPNMGTPDHTPGTTGTSGQ